MNDDLIFRLRKRAEIRRQIPGRKSVENNEPDRIADLLEEAANALEKLSPLEVEFAYSKEYDAYYNPKTNEWIDSRCLDPSCEYCTIRPNRPNIS
jgi:hypothetical protein